MEKLKDIFADKALTYDEFEKALGEAKIKLADLSEGTYVDKRKYEALDADYKKQLEANKQELETLKAKGDNSTELQVKIDALEKEKQELKAKQRETGVQLDKLSRRELASSKTGIHDPDFLDLMQARYGEQKMEDFEKSVVEYAEANKQKWSATSPSPNLNGEPSVKQDADAAMRESIMRAAGAIYDDKK